MTQQETQVSISQWARDTFGPATSNARVAARANEEMAEMLRVLTIDNEHPKAANELDKEGCLVLPFQCYGCKQRRCDLELTTGDGCPMCKQCFSGEV